MDLDVNLDEDEKKECDDSLPGRNAWVQSKLGGKMWRLEKQRICFAIGNSKQYSAT